MWLNLSRIVWLICLCFGYFGESLNAQWVIEDDGCRTPDRGVGNCIPLNDCEPMVTVLKTVQRPISDAIFKRLQAYTCGSSGGRVKVCCPPTPIILNKQKPPQGDDQPPDVSNHRNLYLLPEDCGYLDSDNRIVNGEDAFLNEFPWMALLRYRGRKGLGFNCGGTVINKNYILTAAHCITGLSNSQLISVRVGEHSIKNETDCQILNRTVKCNPPVQDVQIEETIPHPQFNLDGFSSDVALLRVSTMNLSVESVRPVCLPLGKERTRTYDAVFVTGWGVTNTNTGETSDILQKVRLEVANKPNCTNTYQNHGIKLNKKQICAGGIRNKDSCPGDSGGPMMVATINSDQDAIYVQQGIVSFGPKYCGIQGYPGVYTLVNYYMDWILDNIKP